MGYCSRCTLTARWISHTIASFINLEMAEARQGEARVVSSLLLVSPCEVVVCVSWWFVCHICVTPFGRNYFVSPVIVCLCVCKS